MKSIVEEKLVSFKTLEQKVFDYVCELGRQMTRIILERYDDELAEERDKEAFRDKVLDSVYIGGGTPTTLEPDQLRRLLSRLRETFDFSQVKEFTVEAGRADSITADKLRVLKEFGVTRISVNPQTMNQKTLDLIGRRHTVEQVKEAFALARQEGFDNINMDLILGLPGEDLPEVQHTLRSFASRKEDAEHGSVPFHSRPD